MILVALIVQNMRTSLVFDTVAKLVGDVLTFIFICWLATSSVSSLGLGISVDFILDRPSDVAPVPCSLPLHVVESLCSSHLSPSGSPSHISRWNQKTTSLNCVDTNPGRLSAFFPPSTEDYPLARGSYLHTVIVPLLLIHHGHSLMVGFGVDEAHNQGRGEWLFLEQLSNFDCVSLFSWVYQITDCSAWVRTSNLLNLLILWLWHHIILHCVTFYFK